MWGQLAAAKAVVSEPRGMGDDFDAVMAEFYEGIRSGRGALFLAVCRGKVSMTLPPCSQPCSSPAVPCTCLSSTSASVSLFRMVPRCSAPTTN